MEISGNPIRGELLRRAKTLTSKSYGLSEGKRTLLIFGGSQGSRPINMHILENLELYAGRPELQLLWQTGTNDYQKIINAVGERENIKILPFLSDMAGAYSSADIAVCRAGALTIAEHAAEKHQDYNAKLMEDAGAAVVVRQEELSSGALEKVLFELLFDELKLKEMSDAGKAVAHEDAALKIINSLFKMIGLAKA